MSSVLTRRTCLLNINNSGQDKMSQRANILHQYVYSVMNKQSDCFHSTIRPPHVPQNSFWTCFPTHHFQLVSQHPYLPFLNTSPKFLIKTTFLNFFHASFPTDFSTPCPPLASQPLPSFLTHFPSATPPSPLTSRMTSGPCSAQPEVSPRSLTHVTRTDRRCPYDVSLAGA